MTNHEHCVATHAWLAAIVAAASLAWSATAMSQSPSLRAGVAVVDLQELERTFWYCDYLATRHGTGATDSATCSHAYQLLKERKFAGDYELLLAWWRANKPAEHERLSALRVSH